MFSSWCVKYAFDMHIACVCTQAFARVAPTLFDVACFSRLPLIWVCLRLAAVPAVSRVQQRHLWSCDTAAGKEWSNLLPASFKQTLTQTLLCTFRLKIEERREGEKMHHDFGHPVSDLWKLKWCDHFCYTRNSTGRKPAVVAKWFFV